MNLKQAIAAAAMWRDACGRSGAPASAQIAEGVAAIVNDHVISTFDVRQRANAAADLGRHAIDAGNAATRPRPGAARPGRRAPADAGSQPRSTSRSTPEQIDRRMADIARANNMTPEQFLQQLARTGRAAHDAAPQIEADIAWNRLMRGLYGTRVRVSEVEIRETQERIAANATRPQYQISEIFLPADDRSGVHRNGARARCACLQEMQRGAPFPLVARQFSRSPRRRRAATSAGSRRPNSRPNCSRSPSACRRDKSRCRCARRTASTSSPCATAAPAPLRAPAVD